MASLSRLRNDAPETNTNVLRSAGLAANEQHKTERQKIYRSLIVFVASTMYLARETTSACGSFIVVAIFIVVGIFDQILAHKYFLFAFVYVTAPTHSQQLNDALTCVCEKESVEEPKNTNKQTATKRKKLQTNFTDDTKLNKFIYTRVSCCNYKSHKL